MDGDDDTKKTSRTVSRLLAKFLTDPAASPPSISFVSNLLFHLKYTFAIKRILVVHISEAEKSEIFAQIKSFCITSKIELEVLDAKALDPDLIRGAKEMITCDGHPAWRRLPPAWWPREPKMIVVDGLNHATDDEVLRALLDVACIGRCERNELPDGKLPDGSGFVFLAREDFPLKKFCELSDYWHDESMVIEAPLLQS